jgi:hypothetical protein
VQWLPLGRREVRVRDALRPANVLNLVHRDVRMRQARSFVMTENPMLSDRGQVLDRLDRPYPGQLVAAHADDLIARSRVARKGAAVALPRRASAEQAIRWEYAVIIGMRTRFLPNMRST